MKIEINNQAKSGINLKLAERAAKKFARYYKLGRKEISIAFVGDAAIKKLNKIYRGKNEPTDVLSFAGEDNFLGELVIDYAQLKRQAGRFSTSVEKEMVFILVHGLLHLIGYGDETEKDRLKMIETGEKFIKKFKLWK